MTPGPAVSVKLAAVSVNEFISSLKVAVILRLTNTPLPAAGIVEVTLGGVTSGIASVVKHHAKSVVRGLPARSLMPVMIVAVYFVLGARTTAGVKMAM